ncbi:spermatogenic leucine zipper protein 1 [Microcebus murinus]|uniref:spermatogenic leucine zipper protein 1 n=1 Tax=Microcebus murinus TaxID=30608 RepID=UPI0001771910|nr:spermatogenic leucine zipper protein 1 [Microcebus murinus]
MATSAKSAKKPTPSETVTPTADLHQEFLDPRIIVALFEMGLRLPSAWGSLPSLKDRSHQVTEQQTEQKLKYLLKEIKNILKDVADFQEKTTEAKELCEESSISKDMSELKDKIRGLDEINKMLLENLLVSLDPEKEQNTKKQEMIVETQNSKNTVQDFARDLENHSEERKALHEIPQSNETAKCKFPNVQEENQKLRNNMEQLLQEAEHWSEQHTELSELIKSYQKSQEDVKESLEKSGVCFQVQPNNEAPVQLRLEEQVRRLNQDTRSLHLLAASLEHECQLLQQRVKILKELQHHKEGTLQGKAIQINRKQDKKNQKPSETGKVETYKQNIQEMQCIFQKKDRSYKTLDVCRSKKARNNRFNTRIAAALLCIKRPASSLR